MRKTIMATLLAVFTLTDIAQAAIVPVQSLTPPFAATNSSVTKTPDGVHFGVYADAGRTGGSLRYDGANGASFGSLTSLGYTYNYNTSDENRLGSPYLRVFLDADGDGGSNNVVIFEPTLCASVTPPENTDNVVDVRTQTVRVNNDACGVGGTQQPFTTVQAAHADEIIVGIFITQGNAGGQDASAYLRNLTVNANTYAFNVPPASGQPGAPAAPSPTTRATCTGDTIRTLHAPRRARARFLRVNAALLTGAGFRKLKAVSRTVKLDLRNKAEGNYNVRLITHYRTRSGKLLRNVTWRHFSVACA